MHNFDPGLHVGEFVFAPRHANADEGDGWLRGFAVDTDRQTTHFVILTEMDFTGPPQAVVTIPHRIPAAFHGNWVPTRRRNGAAKFGAV